MASYVVPSQKGTEAAITAGNAFAISAAGGYLLAISQPATTTWGKVNELQFGISGAPNSTDCTIIYAVINTTTAQPTGGTSVATPDDPGARAAGLSGMANPTGGATLGSTYSFNIALNQRASYRWTAIPGQEITVPITTLNGLGLFARSQATYASTFTSSMHWFE